MKSRPPFSVMQAGGLFKGLSRLASASLDLLYPPKCVGCEREGRFLCAVCLDTLPHLVPPFCLRCSQPLARGDACRRCLASPLAIDRIVAPFLMEGAAREAVHRLKYNNLRAIAPTLGALLADFLAARQVRGDILVPVPLHPRRERRRGYNQAALLARDVGERLGIPVVSEALVRSKDTPSQTGRSQAEDRRANVQGSFRCPSPEAVNGLDVLLLDDVCTTGSTLEACSVALREAGAASVTGVALAREA